MPATMLAHSATSAVVAPPAIGCNSPALLQTSGALVRLCVPDLWRPLQDPLIILAPEPSVEDNAHSAAERLHAVEARLAQRLSASSTTLPANWATAVTSLRASGLPAVRFASDDLTDALMAFRARRGPPSGVGLLGWGVGGLIATRALEASPPYGAACVICAPIGSIASQLEYLLDLSQLFELHFPGVLPGEAVPTLDAPTQVHVVRLLNGAPETTLRLLRTAGAEVSGEASGTGRNASSSPVASALSLLCEAQAWRAQQRAAFGGRAYSNLHASYSALGLEGDAASSVEDEAVNKAVPREAADAGAMVALREHFETSGPPPLAMRHLTSPQSPPDPCTPGPAERTPQTPDLHPARPPHSPISQRLPPYTPLVPPPSQDRCARPSSRCTPTPPSSRPTGTSRSTHARRACMAPPRCTRSYAPTPPPQTAPSRPPSSASLWRSWADTSNRPLPLAGNQSGNLVAGRPGVP